MNVARSQEFARQVPRLNDDGSVPPDNPFVGREGYRPEIYTGPSQYAGPDRPPETGEIWQHEMAPTVATSSTSSCLGAITDGRR